MLARQPRPTALRNPFAGSGAISLADLRDPFVASALTADPAFDDGAPACDELPQLRIPSLLDAAAPDPLQADPAFDVAADGATRPGDLRPLDELRTPPSFLCVAPPALPDLRAPNDR